MFRRSTTVKSKKVELPYVFQLNKIQVTIPEEQQVQAHPKIRFVLKRGSNTKTSEAYAAKEVPGTKDQFIVYIPKVEVYKQMGQFTLQPASMLWEEKTASIEVQYTYANMKNKFVKISVMNLDLSHFMNQHYNPAEDAFYSYSKDNDIKLIDKDSIASASVDKLIKLWADVEIGKDGVEGAAKWPPPNFQPN